MGQCQTEAYSSHSAVRYSENNDDILYSAGKSPATEIKVKDGIGNICSTTCSSRTPSSGTVMFER